MIIPSIDIMKGEAVQLRQGREHVLTSPRPPVELAREFNRHGPVAVIDLDAALGEGDNLALVRELCRVAEVRCGGGIRDRERGRELLRAGADQLIIGTAATPELLRQFPRERVIVALDHRDRTVVDQGWRRSTGESILDRAGRLAPFCSGFLCTFVNQEGSMEGLPLSQVKELVARLPLPTTVAGGVASTGEAIDLCRAGLDVQVGMALYTGELDLADVVAGSLDFDKVGLVPTIVQERSGQVLMLAYSSPDSLRRALAEGRGVYYSRSRQEIWAKGDTSGNVQELISCRADCDRDALLFTIRQRGPACHTGSHSCFGPRRFDMPGLFEVIRRRRQELPEGSFVTRLVQDRELLLRKLMEEAFELTRVETRDHAQWEAGDLLFFASVLAATFDLDWYDIERELASRSR